VHVASSDEVAGTSGRRYYTCALAAQSDADAERLWQILETIANG
jgi:hypothetical protein